MKRKIALALIGVLSLCLSACGKEGTIRESTTQESGGEQGSEDKEPANGVKETDGEYNELIKKGDQLADYDYIQGTAAYMEAMELDPSREEAYFHLLDVYEKIGLGEGEDTWIQAINSKVESGELKLSEECQKKLNEENRKKWYLASAKVTYYKERDNTQGSYVPKPENISSEYSSVETYYFKYDDKGTLVESDAGDMLAIKSLNLGSFRNNKPKGKIDSDKFDARGVGERILDQEYDYPLDLSYTDVRRTYQWTYGEDGTVYEKGIPKSEYDMETTSEYLFDENNRLAYKRYFGDWGTGIALSDFKYMSDYVQLQNDQGDGSRTHFWEESYDKNGLITKYTVEADSDAISSLGYHTYGGDETCLNFYFEDSYGGNNRIKSRILYYDVLGGSIGGRQSDGTYCTWTKYKEKLMSRVIDLEYVFCKPVDVMEKIQELTGDEGTELVTEQKSTPGAVDMVPTQGTPKPEQAEEGNTKSQDAEFNEVVGMTRESDEEPEDSEESDDGWYTFDTSSEEFNEEDNFSEEDEYFKIYTEDSYGE